ncbi:MAG: hypothetical protein NZ898_09940 [Myxococcota bacterium]|nr:hypothetical protein [Myxococcota bacterium]MDW8362245.1 hypothetical protein [Myxococcales bacterium]
MSTWIVGSCLDRVPGRRYAARLPFAEVAPRRPLPRPATLARSRARLGEDFRVALVAPRTLWAEHVAPLRPGPELDDVVTWIRDAASALRARAVVVPTGSEVSTSLRDRERLAVLLERISDAGRLTVWAPTGLWEPDEVAEQAARMGVLFAYDPLDPSAPRPGGPTAYARLRAGGARRRFGTEALQSAAVALAELACDEGLVAIDSPSSLREATTLARIVSQSLSGNRLESSRDDDGGEDGASEDEEAAWVDDEPDDEPADADDDDEESWEDDPDPSDDEDEEDDEDEGDERER